MSLKPSVTSRLGDKRERAHGTERPGFWRSLVEHNEPMKLPRIVLQCKNKDYHIVRLHLRIRA